MDLKDRKITVMGLGVHGGAVGNIKWLHDKGAKLVVTDLKSRDELEEKVAEIEKLGGVEFVLGEHREEDFIKTDMVIRNPAVPRDSKYLQLAINNGVPIEMDSSLFFKLSPSKNIIGVTGSKGKTTTTHAIGQVLGKDKVTIIGVEGTSPLASLANIDAESLVVFELSSWRLEALNEYQLSPGIAVVTSIYRDHLNTYDSFDDYVATKQGITKWQTTGDKVLLNADDEMLRSWAQDIKAEIWWYSGREFFGDKGIAIVEGEVTMYEGESRQRIMSEDELPLDSLHERRNLLPAILLAIQNEVEIRNVIQNLKTIERLPHRLERVAVIDGAIYVNDSAATMPDATIAALLSFKGKDIIHILGGSDKELEFNELARVLTEVRVKKFIWLPGTATEKMRQVIFGGVNGAEERSQKVEDMSEAVEAAKRCAESGDVILMSPGATSFGLFKHEFDRGNKFSEAVRRFSSKSVRP